MDRTLVFGAILFLLGLMVGISIPWENSSPVQENILSIPSSTHAMGSAGGDSMDMQVYSYNLTLYNSGSQEIYVVSVEPLFDEEFDKLLVSDDHKVYVNKSIAPESAIYIADSMEFNMTGLSKEDLPDIENLTTAIEVNSVFTLPFP